MNSSVRKSAGIDVVIPVYNTGEFVLQAIQSARNQTYCPNQIIIIDDGSADVIRKLIERHFEGDPIIKYVYQPNRGLSAARNRGILESRAEYVAFLDGDDIWEKEKLELQLQHFSKSTVQNLGVVYCDYVNIDEEGRILEGYSCFKLDPTVCGNVFHFLLTGNKVASSGSGVLVRRELFRTAGEFDDSLPSCEDWDMWLRLAQFSGFDFVDRKLVRIRRHASSISRDQKRMFIGTLKLMNKWIRLVQGEKQVLRSWRKEYFWEMILKALKELPEWEFAADLFRTMSPELKRAFVRQLPYLAPDLLWLFRKRLSFKSELV